MCKGERAYAQESNAELHAAAKTIKSLEKEVKGLRKEIGALSGVKKEMRELQQSMEAMRTQAAAGHPS
jgi:prefoldin subunit 5